MYLIINVGSSSVRCSIFANTNKVHTNQREWLDNNHLAAWQEIWQELKSGGWLEKIAVIGQRIVYGQPEMDAVCSAEKKILKKLRKISHLAPLHNPPQLAIVDYCLKNSRQPNYLIFDSAFFAVLPKVAQALSLPYQYYQQGWRKFGFHGFAHEQAAEEAERGQKVISIHIGSGVSLAAILNGRPIATSMAMTPLSGAMMTSRCGDLDPGAVLELVKQNGWKKTQNILYRQSGLAGISGRGSDLRVLLKQYPKNERCRLAVDMFIASIRQYLGAYILLLGGGDVVVFSGAIGQRSPEIRQAVMAGVRQLVPKVKTKIIQDGEELTMVKKLKKHLEVK